MVQVQVQTVGLLKTQQAKLDKLETEVGMLQEKINKGGADADKVCARPARPAPPMCTPAALIRATLWRSASSFSTTRSRRS